MAQRPDKPAATLAAMLRQTSYRGFGPFSAATQAWVPAVNLYQFADRLEACVDLAGVPRERIDVRVEPGRLRIEGVRMAPEPRDGGPGRMRIVGMEIDYGPFRREVPIPRDVDLDKVESRYEQGLLWVTLPLTRASRGGGETR
ncbi:MAG: Hsp20/alpha crystallin family protein [Phycisphaeraceae bacterium]